LDLDHFLQPHPHRRHLLFHEVENEAMKWVIKYMKKQE
jgi:hypothetical protein